MPGAASTVTCSHTHTHKHVCTRAHTQVHAHAHKTTHVLIPAPCECAASHGERELQVCDSIKGRDGEIILGYPHGPSVNHKDPH